MRRGRTRTGPFPQTPASGPKKAPAPRAEIVTAAIVSGAPAAQRLHGELVLSMRSQGGISPKLALRCSINRRSSKTRANSLGRRHESPIQMSCDPTSEYRDFH